MKLALLVLLTAGCYAGTSPDVFVAIRNDEIDALKRAIKADASIVNRADARGTTPLHYAAVYGSPESVRLLLKAGADVKARDAAQATPLILGAYSPEKTRLLIDAGSDVNARTRIGRTPLIIAAGRSGTVRSVEALLDKGADIHAADERGGTAIIAAAAADADVFNLLLARGAKPEVADKGNLTTLMAAVPTNDVQRVRTLIAKGVDVNAQLKFAGKVKHGNIGLTNLTALHLAAADGSEEMVRVLLEAGANVNVRDDRGLTPLMAAIAGGVPNIPSIRLLLKAGADVHSKDIMGATALHWARRSAGPQVVAMLEQAGAKADPLTPLPARTSSPLAARQAAEKALTLVSASTAEFFTQSGCTACHHQPVAAKAYAVAKSSNVAAPEAIIASLKQSFHSVKPMETMFLQFVDLGGDVEAVASVALGFDAVGIDAGPLSFAAAHYAAGRQEMNGSWNANGISRPPAGQSTILNTALSIRLLQRYSWPARRAEFQERIKRGRNWLLQAEPATPYDRAYQLLGLHWSGASSSDLRRASRDLLRLQKSDGGWSQNSYMTSDAYVTGLALHALFETKQLTPSDVQYKNGVAYLLSNQLEDGSWYVRSRSPKFQPYFQAGFPHDHDQWISVMATGYASIALSHAVASEAAPTLAKND